MSDDIDVIEELKAAVADVRASGEKWDGLAPWSYPGGLAAAFLAKHGPALIAAVELAEATKAMEDGLEGPDGYGDMSLVRDYKRAMVAYRAAKKENNHD